MPAAKMIRFHKNPQDGWLQKQFVSPMLVRGSAPSTKVICAARFSSHSTSAPAVAKGSTPEFMKD
jgi:hypothetical protein